MIVREEPHDPRCWLAAHGVYEGGGMPPCTGRLIKAHLVPKQVIYRELGRETPLEVIWDRRIWRWACGGLTGSSGHHGAYDVSRRLRVAQLPDSVHEFCAEHGLQWWTERYARGHA